MNDEFAAVQDFEEVARKLGWDYGRYGLRPPEDAHEWVKQEYEVARTKFGAAPLTHDRFVRKWLQLRASALKRRRIVDPGVTVGLLRAIDTPTCPITLVELTHGKNRDSDWSIDRLDNDGAYAPRNLAVMSRKVNHAKGAKTFWQVYELSEATEDAEGLSPREWLRLACMMYAACHSSDESLEQIALPLATRLHPEVPRHSWYSLQMLLLDACLVAHKRNELIQALNKVCGVSARAEYLKLAAGRLALLVKSEAFKYDALVDDRFQSLLITWLESIPIERAVHLSGYLQARTGGTPLTGDMVARKSVSTKGRMRPQP